MTQRGKVVDAIPTPPAEDVKQKEIEEKAEKKREDIGEAIESRTESRAGGRGGSGRRSLFTAGGGGYLGRFG